MGSTGRTVGTVGGAAIGTALLPGVGTVLGGALGGVVGGLFDSNGDPGAVGQAQYGGGNNPESQFAHQEADRVQAQNHAQATAYDKTGQNMYAGDTAQGAAALGRGQTLGSAAQSNAARLGNTAQSMAFGGQQDAAYNQTRSQNLQNQGVMAANVAGANASQDRGSQLDALGRLQNFYQQGPGPSAAEAQMRQGQDANMAQAIALAHSGRGAGANANAMRSAAFQNAASGQQMNQQLGVLRANEAANWRQQQMGAMGLEQNAMAGMRGQDISQQGNLQSYALGAGQQGLGYGQLGAGYQDIGNKAQEAFSGQGLQGQLGFEGMGNQTNLGFNQAGNQAALGYSQLGNNANQFGESMRNNILQSQGNFNLQQQVANLNAQTGQAATADRRDAANQNLLGSVLNTGVGMMRQGGGGGTSGYGSTYGDGYRT